jgi:hypothetical protein
MRFGRQIIGKILAAILLGLMFSVDVKGDDFYTVSGVAFHAEIPHKGAYPYTPILENGKVVDKTFLPYLVADVKVQEKSRADSIIAKAYFFDLKGKLIEAVNTPSPVERGSRKLYAMPVFFEKNSSEKVFFAVPEKVLAQAKWEAVVIFGDAKSVAASSLPRDRMPTLFDFPERNLLQTGAGGRTPVPTDPVIEYIVKTKSSKQPQITLFLRPPLGLTNAGEGKGVLAMCLLANDVGDVKRRLQLHNANDEVGGILKFAEQHKLVILCWGATRLWDPNRNWDELGVLQQEEIEDTFEAVARAWCKGVEELSMKYGIPTRNYLLWGSSGAAQYAKRLALHRPEYFNAVHIHIPSSFGKPTIEARRVLWCLTTGELEAGYERSKKFYLQCRELGYPIIYKAIPGLGHEGSSIADNLGLKFFEYALGRIEEREVFESEMRNPFSKVKQQWEKSPQRPWPNTFRMPFQVGDIVNQEAFVVGDAAVVPDAFRVALPTAEIAKAWSKSP